MSVEICVYPPLSLEEINSDENLLLKQNENDQNNEWLYFKNNPISDINSGFLYRYNIEIIQEFVEYMWTKYKKLTGFDGWGENGDGMFRLIMESSKYNENIKIDDKNYYDILAVECLSDDTITWLPDNLKNEVELYKKNNEPLYQKLSELINN